MSLHVNPASGDSLDNVLQEVHSPHANVLKESLGIDDEATRTPSPSATHKVATKMVHNKTTALLHRMSFKELDWRIDDSISMTQGQSYYFVTEDGAFVFLQLAYANIGWKPNCQISARYFKPGLLVGNTNVSTSSICASMDAMSLQSASSLSVNKSAKSASSVSSSASSYLGSLFGGKKSTSSSLTSSAPSNIDLDGVNEFYSETISAAEWKLKPDNFSSEIGPFRSTISADGKSIDLMYQSAKLRLMLTLKPEHETELPCLAFTDGRVEFEKKNGDALGYMQMRFAPSVSLSGIVQIGSSYSKVLSGSGTIAHITQGVKPHLAATFWAFAIFKSAIDASDSITLTLCHFVTPPTFGSVMFNQGVITVNGSVASLSIHNSVALEELELDTKSGYKIPRRVTYELKGETKDHEPFSAKIVVRPTILVERIDLLNQVPFLLRKVIQAFFTKPFCYEWFDDVTLELTLHGKTRLVQGKYFHELTILN